MFAGSTEVVVYDPATVLTPTYLPPTYSQPGRLSFGGRWGLAQPPTGGAELSYSVGGDEELLKVAENMRLPG